MHAQPRDAHRSRVTSRPAKLGVIAGAGDMPRQIVSACEAEGRSYFIVAVDEFAPEFEGKVPHKRVPISKIGAAMAALKDARCVDVVLAGKLQRPDGRGVKLRPDFGGLEFLVRLGSLGRSDDKLHRTIETMLRARGMKVVSPLDVAPNLAARPGTLTRTQPSKEVAAGFPTALRLAKEHGATKRGQAVVVRDGEVVAREERAGTDAMLTTLGAEAKGGVLVKAMSPTQLTTIDPPAIGVGTVENVAKAGLSGILIEAGRSVVMEEARVRARADELGLFVWAIRAEGS